MLVTYKHLSVILLILLPWVNTQVEAGHTASFAEPAPLAHEPIKPVPMQLELNAIEVALGMRLFFDNGLSTNGKMSCGSCHYLDRGMADGLVFSIDINGKPKGRNTQSLYNIGLQYILEWDGGPNSLEAQALKAIPKALGVQWQQAIAYLRADSSYRQTFDQLYDDGITPENVANSIAAFERSLITPDSRFDQYLRGDPDILVQQEEHGYQLFKQYGCVSCHNGVAVGGNMIAKLGQFTEGEAHEDEAHEDEHGIDEIINNDQGRYKLTGRERDMLRFKVPSLRNVELTAPYFHSGSIDTLEEAVKEMAEYQLGIDLPEQDIESIVAFLKTLTGKYQGEQL